MLMDISLGLWHTYLYTELFITTINVSIFMLVSQQFLYFLESMDFWCAVIFLSRLKMVYCNKMSNVWMSGDDFKN